MTVLVGDEATIEAVQSYEGLAIQELVVRPIGNKHIGQCFPYPRSLYGIVVNEHRGIERKVEFGYKLDNVGGLVLPIYLPSRQILLPYHHLRAFPDRL